MTLEKTIQSMFDRFPVLFQTRADCLNHLFCTLGNGYKWENGELVRIFPITPTHSLDNGRAKQYLPLTIRSAFALNAEKGHQPINKVLLNVLPDTPLTDMPRRNRWYFVQYQDEKHPEVITLYKEDVPLWNAPADIKPDWLAGIQECKAMLLEDGIIQKSDV